MKKIKSIVLLLIFFMLSYISAQNYRDSKKDNFSENKKSKVIEINQDTVKLTNKTLTGKIINIELERIKFPYDNEFFIKWYVDWDLNWYKPQYLVKSIKVEINGEKDFVAGVLRYGWLDPHRIWIENIVKDTFIVYIEGADASMSYKVGLLYKGHCLEEVHYYDELSDKPNIHKIGCVEY